jgi:two-component system, chemotaxis family, CheB/CheR fusion protein
VHRDDEEELLRSVALQNAQSILAARQRAEQEMLKAKEALEHKTQELSRALATMQATLESTWDGTLAVDERGIVTAFNQTYVGMWRLPATIIESRDHRRIVAFVAPQLRDPPAFVERVEAIYLTSPGESSDILEFADGRVFERYSRIQTIDDRNVGRVWTFRDVTERRRADQATALLGAIVDSSDDAIISKDLNGIITSWNKGAEHLFGYTPSEAVGQPITMLIPADRLDEETHILERLKAGARVEHFETIRVRKDGSRRDVSLTISPVKSADGQIIGASKIARDITERRRAEEALRHAKQTAEAASRAKDEFLAMLGHELRNPLGAIHGAVSVLDLKGKADDETAQLREILHRQAAHLTRLLDDLLDVTRLATGKIELQRRPVDLQTVAEGALRSLAEGGKAAQHAISFMGQTLWVDGDPTRLEQVIFNLLDNAVKYTPPDGRIMITIAEAGGLAVLRIADTGVGMTEEFVSRVFEPFAQAHQTLDRARGGLGLGLTLVKRLVELHGGAVAAHSRGLGRGTEVLVQLPLTEARGEPEVIPPSEAGVGPCRVLIVDDDSDMRTTLRMLLQVGGHQVDEAVDGVEALEMLLRLRPDVAFIDLGLPGRDGYELAQAVRSAPGGESLYLVALTGYGQPQDRRRALEVGFNVYLVKPVSLDDLTSVLAAAPADR